MRGFKPGSFAERRSASLAARKAALEDFRRKAAADVAAFPQRQEALKAVRMTREVRVADRQAISATHEAEITQQAAREHANAIQTEREDGARAGRDRAEAARRETARQVEGKAARDARYAARKARQ